VGKKVAPAEPENGLSDRGRRRCTPRNRGQVPRSCCSTAKVIHLDKWPPISAKKRKGLNRAEIIRAVDRWADRQWDGHQRRAARTDLRTHVTAACAHPLSPDVDLPRTLVLAPTAFINSLVRLIGTSALLRPCCYYNRDAAGVGIGDLISDDEDHGQQEERGADIMESRPRSVAATRFPPDRPDRAARGSPPALAAVLEPAPSSSPRAVLPFDSCIARRNGPKPIPQSSGTSVAANTVTECVTSAAHQADDGAQPPGRKVDLSPSRRTIGRIRRPARSPPGPRTALEEVSGPATRRTETAAK